MIVATVPDYVEPFEAWRAWTVLRREGVYSIGSVVKPTLWPAGEVLVARCLVLRFFQALRRKPEHDAPGEACECGIYAAGLDGVGQYVSEPPCRGVASVIGRVALWGTVVECERGYRASHAYPTRIYVPSDAGDPWQVDWDEVAFGLTRYGVPVERLEVSAAEATSHLAERQAA